MSGPRLPVAGSAGGFALSHTEAHFSSILRFDGGCKRPRAFGRFAGESADPGKLVRRARAGHDKAWGVPLGDGVDAEPQPAPLPRQETSVAS